MCNVGYVRWSLSVKRAIFFLEVQRFDPCRDNQPARAAGRSNHGWEKERKMAGGMLLDL